MKGLPINKNALLIGLLFFFNIQLAEKEEEKKIKATIKRKSKKREKKKRKKKERKNTRYRRRFCNENKIGLYCLADTSWRR